MGLKIMILYEKTNNTNREDQRKASIQIQLISPGGPSGLLVSEQALPPARARRQLSRITRGCARARARAADETCRSCREFGVKLISSRFSGSHRPQDGSQVTVTTHEDVGAASPHHFIAL